MLSYAFVLASLSGGQKVGLAAVGVAFIVFALVSSLVLPRRNPNFPGKGMGWYVTLCALFFVAMISAVLVFGREKEEQAGNESPAHTATVSGSLPGQTSTPTTTEASGGGGSSLETKGDPAAGKQVFASAGCSGCHTLKAAGASGNVGPNLDQLKPDENAVHDQVEHGGGGMPAFKGQLTDEQIQNVAAFVFASTHS
jgi:mono/diheme cytochrome c family protein